MDNAERALVDVIKGRGSIGALLGISADDVEQLVQLGRGSEATGCGSMRGIAGLSARAIGA